MPNKNNQCNGGGRDRRKIARWETKRTVLDQSSLSGPLRMSLNIAIERPIFANNDPGFYRLNATIRVGSYFVRLATAATIDLMNMFRDNYDNIMDATDEIRDLNDKQEKEKRQEQEAARRSRAKEKEQPPDYNLLEDSSLRKTRGGMHFSPKRRRRFRP
jgi:hypothetical protein